jgi:hypothetical protein
VIQDIIWRGKGRNCTVQRLTLLQVKVCLGMFFVLRVFMAGLKTMSASRVMWCRIVASRMWEEAVASQAIVQTFFWRDGRKPLKVAGWPISRT